jgi:hypothetical protein
MAACSQEYMNENICEWRLNLQWIFFQNAPVGKFCYECSNNEWTRKIHIQTSNKDYPSHVSYNKLRIGNAIIIIVCDLLTGLAFMMTTEEPKDELSIDSHAIVKLDFIILCFLPAEVELTSQALNAWGRCSTPHVPLPQQVTVNFRTSFIMKSSI